MVGKQALLAISERQNKASTSKDSILVCAETYEATKRAFEEKGKDNIEEKKDKRVDVKDIKDNLEPLVYKIKEDIEER